MGVLTPVSIKTPRRRRRRLLTRGFPLVLLAALAFAGGAVISRAAPERDAAERFLEAWQEQDYPAMHDELTPEAAQRFGERRLRRAYRSAQRTATVEGIGIVELRGPEDRDGADVVVADVVMRTGAFGEIAGELALPVGDDGIAWQPRLVFPGLRRGETLARRTEAPPRAPILAEDGTPLAQGPASARSSPLGAAATNVAGEIGQPDAAQKRRLEELGFPTGTLAGTSGLEKAFNERLSGRPGGELIAQPAEGAGNTEGARVLGEAEPQRGKPLRTTIDPTVQEAAVAALGGQFGGVAAIDARNGAIRGLAGIAFSAPQPPGSTFKIITTVAALEAEAVTLGEEFPVQTSAPVGGREIANAYDESCGGSFAQSFAHSCNSVFAPLGAEVGGERLLETAERFGFNARPSLFNRQALDALEVPASTIPNPIGDELDVGVSAIGQGEVLATPLVLASIAQTIAARGTRSPTPLVRGKELRGEAEPVEVTSSRIAETVRDLMVGVVESGTGIAAALPDVQVAGKTGTAELGPSGPVTDGEGQPEQDVDAWFTAFAPAGKPELAVAAMVVNADADGGSVAAPIVREVLAAGL